MLNTTSILNRMCKTPTSLQRNIIVTFGWLEGRNPSEYFNTIWYLHSYEDAVHSGPIRLIHYAREGYLDESADRPGRIPGNQLDE